MVNVFELGNFLLGFLKLNCSFCYLRFLSRKHFMQFGLRADCNCHSLREFVNLHRLANPGASQLVARSLTPLWPGGDFRRSANFALNSVQI